MADLPPKPLLRPGKIILLAMAALIVYLVAVIALVPAGWLWQQAQARVAMPPQVEVKQVNGQLWEGVAGLVIAGYPVRAEWALAAPSLSTLSLPVQFSLSTAGSALRGNMRVSGQGSGEVQASGVVGVAEFEPLIRQSGGAVIEGNVSIDRIDLAWANQTLTRADGLARWDGGTVTWPMGGSQERADFPPMQATLGTAADGIALVVSEQGEDGPAATVDINWNGMMDLRVYKRMVDLARQPWPDSAQPDDVVLRVRQPVIPGGALR